MSRTTKEAALTDASSNGVKSRWDEEAGPHMRLGMNASEECAGVQRFGMRAALQHRGLE